MNPSSANSILSENALPWRHANMLAEWLLGLIVMSQQSLDELPLNCIKGTRVGLGINSGGFDGLSHFACLLFLCFNSSQHFDGLLVNSDRA